MDDESSHREGTSNGPALSRRGRAAPMEGARVLILTGRFKGEEGVCLGKGTAEGFWTVSPDCSDEILSLVFAKDFGLLVDLSADPTRN